MSGRLPSRDRAAPLKASELADLREQVRNDGEMRLAGTDHVVMVVSPTWALVRDLLATIDRMDERADVPVDELKNALTIAVLVTELARKRPGREAKDATPFNLALVDLGDALTRYETARQRLVADRQPPEETRP